MNEPETVSVRALCTKQAFDEKFTRKAVRYTRCKIERERKRENLFGSVWICLNPFEGSDAALDSALDSQ